MKINLKNFQYEEFIVAIEVLGILSKYGNAYFVGGCVRDMLLNKNPKDIDISTDVSMEKIEELFNSHDIGKNKDFGIVVINYKNYTFEIAQFRTDGTYTDNRHPDNVKLGVSFKEDTMRRDFTINAMGMDHCGNIIDYHNGIEDLNNKKINSVGKADDRFREDALRMLRAIRFTVALEFSLSHELMQSIIKNKELIRNVSKERVREELLKVATLNDLRKFHSYIRWMDMLHLFKILFGEKYMPYNVINNYADMKVSDISILMLFSIVNSDVLYPGYDVQSYLDLLKEYKFTNEEINKSKYLITNLHLIPGSSLGKINRLDALNIINNVWFKDLLKTYTLYENEDIDMDTIEKISNLNVCLDMKKQINQYILDKNVTGKHFGVVSGHAIDFLFYFYERFGCLPNDLLLHSYIDNLTLK